MSDQRELRAGHRWRLCRASIEGYDAPVHDFARGVKIVANFIFGNVPSGPTAFKGGVVVVRGDQGTPPKNNLVIKNTILKNRPDIFWDESGSGNRFVANHCKTSKPGGLCKTKK